MGPLAIAEEFRRDAPSLAERTFGDRTERLVDF
jgi:hypothetical protein